MYNGKYDKEYDDDERDYLGGGLGYDTYYVGNFDEIKDVDGHGIIFFNSIRLNGGEYIEECGNEGNGGDNIDLKGKLFISQDKKVEYYVSDSDLIVNYNQKSIKILSWRNGDLGITLDIKPQDCDVPPDDHGSPLILDLDGDGIETTQFTEWTVFFDIDNDGIRELTAWVGPDDGLLALDRDGDGMITSGHELFGYGETISLQGDSPVLDPNGLDIQFESGFAKLQEYDLNYDGRIDAEDEIYAELRVWKDLNQDGVSDEGELLTLEEANVASISLWSYRVNEMLGANFISDRSAFETFSGETRQVADVWFKFDQTTINYDIPELFDPEIEALPYIVSPGGRVKDLHTAMAEDPVLKKLVQDFTALGVADMTAITAAVDEIMLRWHGVTDDVDTALGRGAYASGEHVGIVEALFDLDFEQWSGPMPRPYAGAIMEDYWDVYHRNIAVGLIAQTELGQQLFPEISYKSGMLSLEESASSAQMLSRLAANAPDGHLDKIAYWHAALRMLDTVYGSFGDTDDASYRQTVNELLEDQGLYLTYFELITARIGGDGADGILTQSVAGGQYFDGNREKYASVVHGGRGDDEIVLGGGKQILYWGTGQGDDNVTLSPISYLGWEFTPAVEIRMPELSSEDVEITHASDGSRDLIISVKATGERLTVQNAIDVFEKSLIARDRSPYDYKPNLKVNLIFSDSEPVDIKTVIGTLPPSSGDDTIFQKTTGLSTLDGGAGNDTLVGSKGVTTYVFGRGYGVDTIKDTDNGNIVRFKSGLSESDLKFAFLSDGTFEISILGSEDRLLIPNFVGATGRIVTQFVFEDGHPTLSDMDAITRSFAATDGDDFIVGTRADDLIDGKGGNDRLNGGEGSDTYVFGPGYGHDVIREISNSTTDTDRVLVGFSFAEIDFASGANQAEFILIAPDGGTLNIGGSISGSFRHYDVEEFVFTDRTLTAEEMYAHIYDVERTYVGTDGPDTIVASGSRDDLITGGKGDDVLSGGASGDTYFFAADHGADTINEAANQPGDTVVFEDMSSTDFSVRFNAGDLLITNLHSPQDSVRIKGQTAGSFRIENFMFADGVALTARQMQDLVYAQMVTEGDDLIIGTAAAETFAMSNGNDRFEGRGGDDRYIREAHISGDHQIFDTGNYDRLFLNGLTPDDVQLSASGENVILTLPNGSVTLVGQRRAPGDNVIEEIRFGDGTVWAYDQITAQLRPGGGATLLGDGSDNALTGTAADETLDGLGGNDVLRGGGGSDVYVYGLGYGNDLIIESGGRDNIEVDRVSFKDLTVEDLIFEVRPNSDNVFITIAATGETLTIQDQLRLWAFTDHPGLRNSETAVEFFEFSDGVVWNRLDLRNNLVLFGTNGADSISPIFRSAAGHMNNINGGKGNDTLWTSLAEDKFYFKPGDGVDKISRGQNGAANNHDMVVIHDVSLDDIRLERINKRFEASHLQIHYGDGDKITVENQFAADDANSGIGILRLINGSEIVDLDQDDIRNLTIFDDRIFGTDGPDILVGDMFRDRIFAVRAMTSSGPRTETTSLTADQATTDLRADQDTTPIFGAQEAEMTSSSMKYEFSAAAPGWIKTGRINLTYRL